MDAGVKVREYTGSVLHAKSMVVDDRLAVVGSANFDILSISMNWEHSARVCYGSFKDCQDLELR